MRTELLSTVLIKKTIQEIQKRMAYVIDSLRYWGEIKKVKIQPPRSKEENTQSNNFLDFSPVCFFFLRLLSR